MFTEYQIEILNQKNAKAIGEVRDFLAGFDLSFDDVVEYTINLRLDGKLVGTGSFQGEVLRNIAVDESIQGAGLTAKILSELMQEQARRGRLHYFIFTKPSKAYLFEGLGFVEIARAEPYVALLEMGIGSVATYCESIRKATAHLTGNFAAIVVNCNPFTKGHQALIRQASKENEAVIVFVVSEDRSLFPFEDRFKLVKEGVADLANVAVVPTGKYMVSAATFPTYFTRNADKAAAQAALDITLFAKKIAPSLGIKARYIGEEPYCPVTNAYNDAMLAIFPQHGIKIKVIERVQVEGEIISASKVREMIRQDDWEAIKKFVPENTYHYLRSAKNKNILEKIHSSNTRH
ncbi:MAG: [citrate (pro-3S)-lyase] ligase [Sporomusaceae bacterium]|nr:[citrate (pro-3S)-lyase] ligase [Sporomusaceae bacterium]